MKKIICLFLIIVLTGCIANSDLKKTCTYENKTTHIDDKTIIEVIYDGDDVVKEAIITKKYKALDEKGVLTLKNIKESNETYNKRYSDMEIMYYVSKDIDNEFTVKYKLDVQKIDNVILKEFNLRKNAIKFFNKMREENIECEVS